MKIGLVCPYNMFEHSGGVNQVVIHLAEGLRKKGHKVKIITSRPVSFKDDPPDDYILLGRCRRMNTGFGTVGDVTFELDNDEVKAVIEKEKFDVINFHEPWVPMLARQILPISNAAHVATFHANLSENLAAKSFVNVFLPYGRGIGEQMHVLTAVSPAAASTLINKGPENALVKDIQYIPNGIDLKVYKPYKHRISLSGPGTQTIVYVGRLERRKGAEWLVRAFGELVKEMPNTHLIIAGKGSRANRLKEIIDDLKIPNVTFAGYVDDERKRYLIGNADIFCSPAMFGESFGIVLLEAMAMGTPVIAGNNIGYATVLEGHGRLSLVDAEATSDFANRLAVFLSDNEIRRLWIDWATTEVKQYDYRRITNLYEKVYAEAITKAKLAKHLKNGKNGRSLKSLGRRLFIRRHTR